MFEIIPNWHPLFVHFTVALVSLAAVLFAITPFMKSPLKEQWQTVARWNLWFGAGFTIITHEPIASLGWKSMTMDFPVQNPALLKNLKPGVQQEN